MESEAPKLRSAAPGWKVRGLETGHVCMRAGQAVRGGDCRDAGCGISGDGKKRIALVDDHPIMRAGMAWAINREPELGVCCEAGDAAEALRLVRAGRPDLA